MNNQISDLIGQNQFMQPASGKYKLFFLCLVCLLFWSPISYGEGGDVALPPPAQLLPGQIQRNEQGEITLIPGQPSEQNRAVTLNPSSDISESGNNPGTVTPDTAGVSRKPSKPGELLFVDRFEYVANMHDSNVVNIFKQHGWSHVKTAQDPGSRHPLGYLYTTDKIPGFSGTLPTKGERVLAIDARPTSMGDFTIGHWGGVQTDFYLQWGNGRQDEAVPADVWFQFWVYPTGNYDHGMKFIYPCNSFYPCRDLKWLFITGTLSSEPFWNDITPEGRIDTNIYSINNNPAPHQFMTLVASNAKYSVPSYGTGNGNELGQTSVNAILFSKRWTKVKLHIDTTGPQGIYEAWLQPQGEKEIKVAEWIGNVTPNFTWPTTPGGHKMFRIPTTVGSPRALDRSKNYDSITYIDDFSMATSEDALPKY